MKNLKQINWWTLDFSTVSTRSTIISPTIRHSSRRRFKSRPGMRNGKWKKKKMSNIRKIFIDGTYHTTHFSKYFIMNNWCNDYAFAIKLPKRSSQSHIATAQYIELNFFFFFSFCVCAFHYSARTVFIYRCVCVYSQWKTLENVHCIWTVMDMVVNLNLEHRMSRIFHFRFSGIPTL